jgi:hypothetical protein
MPKQMRIVALACASAAFAGVTPLAAQSTAEAPEAPNLRGTVHSVSGHAIDGVEVRIDGSNAVTRTDPSGTFTFMKAPKGPQMLKFRLLGYLPTTAAVRVPSTSDALDVTMLATPRALDTVKVVARVNVLAGIVVDHHNKPIPDAAIEVLNGNTTNTKTNDDGWFTFTSVKDGPVLVRARKLGFAPTTTSIHLEDWRGLVIHLEPIDENLSGKALEEASGFGNTNTFVWSETQQRLTMRGSHAIVIPREELAEYDDLPLGQAIPRTKTGQQEAADLNAAGSSVCVLLNGKSTVGPASLQNFHTDDVEFAELYPPNSENSGTVSHYLRSSGCRRVTTPSSMSPGVYYVVIWLRG